jgi:hypothetical protein
MGSASVTVALSTLLLCQWAFAGDSHILARDKKRPANPFTLVSSEPFPALANKLKGTEGFVGGDSAYSIKLAPNKSLWLFGDSFIGKIIGGKRSDCKMVRNAIALDDQSKSGNRPTFYDPLPAFFKAPPKNFFWPGDGVMLEGKLYLFLHETETSKDRRPPFQFNPYTDHLIIVQDPLSDPTKWRVRDCRIGNPSSQRLIGIACLLEGDYLYIYCADSAIGFGMNKNPTALARIKKADLQTGKTDKIEWLAEGWHNEANFLDTLWEDGASEMTVTKLPGLPGYFAFYLPFGNNAVLMRHADEPEGPWSKSIAVYKLPRTAPNFSTDIFFYSAKAHPQYSSAKGEVVLTYCSNSNIFSRVLGDARLYFPEAVKIKIARTN